MGKQKRKTGGKWTNATKKPKKNNVGVKAGLILLGLLAASSAVKAQDLKHISVVAGIGVGVPVRSQEFVDETNGAAFYKTVSAEYVVNKRINLGVTYGGETFDMAEGPALDATQWGPYALVNFDLIPENDWTLFLKFGAQQTNVEDITPQWQLFSGGGVEFYPVNANVRMRVGIDFSDLHENRIGALFGYLALCFEPFALGK